MINQRPDDDPGSTDDPVWQRANSTPRRNRAAALLLLTLAGVLTSFSGFAATANAAGTEQVSGSAFYQTADTDCAANPLPTGFDDFDSYPALVLSGSLQGCWYTRIETARQRPSGTYQETGQEIFVGTLDGGPAGTFVTTYRFEAKLAPDGTEIRGRCQHPIVSGTGAFENATGLILFKDAPPRYFYRGHVRLG